MDATGKWNPTFFPAVMSFITPEVHIMVPVVRVLSTAAVVLLENIKFSESKRHNIQNT